MQQLLTADMIQGETSPSIFPAPEAKQDCDQGFTKQRIKKQTMVMWPIHYPFNRIQFRYWRWNSEQGKSVPTLRSLIAQQVRS